MRWWYKYWIIPRIFNLTTLQKHSLQNNNSNNNHTTPKPHRKLIILTPPFHLHQQQITNTNCRHKYTHHITFNRILVILSFHKITSYKHISILLLAIFEPRYSVYHIIDGPTCAGDEYYHCYAEPYPLVH